MKQNPREERINDDGKDVYKRQSMNPLMIDGTGMCGGCRVKVGDEYLHACVDGPDFDGHLVDFDDAMRRGVMYRSFEAEAREGRSCGAHAGDERKGA